MYGFLRLYKQGHDVSFRGPPEHKNSLSFDLSMKYGPSDTNPTRRIALPLLLHQANAILKD
jgi:hypothetical protein